MTAVVRCEDYDRREVRAAMERIFELSGGLACSIKPGMRVLLKCNLVSRSSPKSAVVTHPEVVRAVAELVRELGATPIIGDSPGGPFTVAALRGCYKQAGYIKVAEQTGAELCYDVGTGRRDYPHGRAMRTFQLTNMALNADAVISLGKLKTHGLTLYTGAVKNLFGCVPGVEKAALHARFPALVDFSNMLVDLCECIAPVFSIVDGIVAMQGEGPTSGEPRSVHALVGGANPHQVDLAAAALIALTPDRICTLTRAIERGLLQPNAAELCGDPIDLLRVSDFKLPKTSQSAELFQRLPHVGRVIQKLVQPHPVFKLEHCTGCGMCARSCPVKAITMNEGCPRVRLKNCIHCFCCQELCPSHTVDVEQAWAVRLLH